MEKEDFALDRSQRPEKRFDITLQAGFLTGSRRERRWVGLIERLKLRDFSPPALIDKEIPHRGGEDRVRGDATVTPAKIQPRLLYEILRVLPVMRQRECVAKPRLESLLVGNRIVDVG
jgi:hypothetical protein